MRNKFYIISLYIFIWIIHKCFCEELSDFVVDLYDSNFTFIEKRIFTYNYTSYEFQNNDKDKISEIENIKTIIICSKEDADKNDDEKNIILFWTTSLFSGTYDITSTYLSAFPLWVKKMKSVSDKTFCFKIQNVGWVANVNDPICIPDAPCPDLIILGTTQFAYRYNRGETLNLEKYLRIYYKKTGKTIESLINKYSFYDYHLDNNWLGIPLIVDFRSMKFNVTTFDYCKNKGYDLHYPPPLSDYWGTNYQETWTWEKAFEYAKIITECTNEPGFKIYANNSYEDTKFFIVLCQALGIPFITDDAELNIKKCGFRNKEHIKKLSLIKELFENHYIKDWLEPDQIYEWQNNPYPTSIESQPKFRLYNDKRLMNETYVNGMMFSISNDRPYSDLKYAYMPGSSTFLGGSGIIITKASKFPDELFEYIEILINENYPYFTRLNAAVTPFENIHGRDCIVSLTSKDHCNFLLENNGTFPYYFNYDNSMNVIYLTHISVDDDRGILIDLNNSLNSKLSNKSIFRKKVFKCDETEDYQKNTITNKDDLNIKLPINSKETIILKSMTDITTSQTTNMICSIFDKSLKIAKPYQFPYSTFPEINILEYKSPISILLAHLYYKHNNTNEGSFEDIVNECCDIIDDIFLSECTNPDKISYSVSSCDEINQIMNITYNNCKVGSNEDIDKTVECPYIPYRNIKGIMTLIFSALGLVIELIFLIIVIIFRREKCIYIGGFSFLIFLVISSIFLDSSIIFLIGKLTKFKCILKFWLTILGITGFIFSYSVKSEVIIAIYNARNVIKSNNKRNTYTLYSIIIGMQVIMLIMWTFTHEGVILKNRNLKFLINFQYESCSLGNESILTLIFSIDYILLLLSVLTTYRGRNIPAEFNESKKVFVCTLVFFLILILCHTATVINFDDGLAHIIISTFIIVIIFIINLTFIGSKLSIIFELEPKNSIIVIDPDDSINSTNKHAKSEAFSNTFSRESL